MLVAVMRNMIYRPAHFPCGLSLSPSSPPPQIHLKVKFSGPPIDTFPLPDDDDGVSGGKGKASPSKTLANGYTYESFN